VTVAGRLTNLMASSRGLARARPTLIAKPSDTTRSSTTFAADPHLILDLDASAIYRWDGFLRFSGNDNIGIKIKFLMPSGCAGYWVAVTDMGGASINLTEVHSTTELDAMSWASSHRAIKWQGHLLTDTTAGQVTLSWAAWNSGSITLYTGSWMEARRCD
jgi:hypothetical protein